MGDAGGHSSGGCCVRNTKCRVNVKSTRLLSISAVNPVNSREMDHKPSNLVKAWDVKETMWVADESFEPPQTMFTTPKLAEFSQVTTRTVDHFPKGTFKGRQVDRISREKD